MERLSRMILSDNSVEKLHMRCYFVSSDYRCCKELHKRDLSGHGYIKDIFDDE